MPIRCHRYDRNKNVGSLHLQPAGDGLAAFSSSVESVRFKITDALIVYAGGQDADVDQGAVHRAEIFFINQETRKQRQSGYDNDQIVNALNNFSESLFRSYEEMVLRQN